MDTHTMSLHELSQASLGGDSQAMEPACALALAANFGSVESWRASFVACARAQRGAAGWVLLVFQPGVGTLVNQWTVGPGPAADGSVPILALDLQAQPLDRDATADARIDAFVARINWPRVYARYQAAVHDASEPWAAAHDRLDGAVLLDVRRAGVYAQASSRIPGAHWCDPADVARWGAELPAGQDVVVYCVYGHEVGRATALRLRAAGLNARYLEGGIDGWTRAGRPLADKLPGASP